VRSPDFIRDRAKNLRRNMTGPERTLWFLLRRNSLGWHFRRQHPIGPFILDFYCAPLKLCVEVDGPVHIDLAERDARRTAWLQRQGITVLRFSTEEVEVRPAAVIAAIAAVAPPATA
jgi:very-short-patch-repair endonuclease